MAESPSHSKEGASTGSDRRRFLSAASSVAMAGGLVGGYGTLVVMAGRFLYPARPRELAWTFVAHADQLKPGQALQYRSPAGETITITRTGPTATAADFLALSSTCPHLGCQVHWEPQNTRFFCPCHNGAFDAQGKAIAGPPADAGQSLPRYDLQVQEGLLFIQVPVQGLKPAGGRQTTADARPSSKKTPCPFRAQPATEC